MGLELNKHSRFGCGLFATRNFKENDVIAPYTGIYKSEDAGGPYCWLMNGYRVVIDAALKRSWASMANHPFEHKSENCHIKEMTIPKKYTQPALPENKRVKVLYDKNIFFFPSSLLQKPYVGTYQAWMVAKRPIKKGEEILLNYGSDADGIISYVHETKPSLCGDD